MDTESSSAGKAVIDSTSTSPVVIDLGKKRRKQVKDLRKGKQGKLLSEVTHAIEVLKTDGAISANAQPIIVIVQPRRRKNTWGV